MLYFGPLYIFTKNFRLCKKFEFYRLLYHELSHARKIAGFQSQYQPYIVLGCKTKDINISEGEKQFKNYPCAKFKGFSVYKICDLKFAVTEIDNRRVLSEEQVKEAVIAPVLKEYIGIILGFILFAGAFSLILYCLIFKNLPIYFFAIGLVLLMLSIFLCKWYEPEGVPSLWKQAKKKTAIVICIIIQNTIIHMVVEYIPHPIVKTRFFELKLFPFRFILIDFGYGTVFGVELCR